MPAERVVKCEFPGMQAEWRRGGFKCLDAERRGRVGGITEDRMTEVLEVNADLVGAACDGNGF